MTQEALRVVHTNEDISPIDYLLLWFGIIGAPVGLSVPSAVVNSISIPEDSDVQHTARSECETEEDLDM